METVLDKVGIGVAQEINGEQFFELHEREDFSFEEVKYTLFKESLVFASLYYKYPLYLKDYNEFILEKVPIIKGFGIYSKHAELIEHIFRADSLFSFFKIEIEKGKKLDTSGKKCKIKDIPFPVYIPNVFLEKLEKVIFNLSEIGCSEDEILIIEEGFDSFKDIIDVYKGKIYPLLFEYLQAKDTENKMSKRGKLLELYNHTIRLVYSNKTLLFFCKKMQIDVVLRDIYKKSVEPLVSSRPNSKIKHFEVRELEEYYEELRDTFIVANKEDMMLLPFGFASDFSLDVSAFGGPSLQNMLLHYLPLVQVSKLSDNKHKEKWKKTVETSDINRLFFFKQREVFSNKEMGLRDEGKILEILEINIAEIKKSVKREVNTLFDKIKERKYFIELNTKEQIFKLLNVIRLSLKENDHISIKINDSFYANMQEEKLRDMVVEIMDELFTALLENNFNKNKKDGV